MITLRLIMEGEGAFKDVTEYQTGNLDAITLLEDGTTGGRPAIGMLVKVDGSDVPVIAQTSWRALHAAVRAFEARYGAPD